MELTGWVVGRLIGPHNVLCLVAAVCFRCATRTRLGVTSLAIRFGIVPRIIGDTHLHVRVRARLNSTQCFGCRRTSASKMRLLSLTLPTLYAVGPSVL